MKIEINIDNTLSGEMIVIHAPEMTKELQQALDSIKKIYHKKTLKGRMGDDIHLIEIDEITQFVMENQALWAVVSNGEKLKLDERLYQVEEILDRDFVRISKSEIVNIRYIKRLKMMSNGMIEIIMKQGGNTYSSRRYLKSIKERLEL